MSEQSMHAEASTSPAPAVPVREIRPGESLTDWLRQFGQATVDAFRRESRRERREAREESPADDIPPIETTTTRRGRASDSVEREWARETSDDVRGKKSLLKEPPMFDGNKEEYEDWRRKVFVYINDDRNRIVRGDEKINIALSFMEGKEIRGWVKNLWSQYYDEDIGRWIISWATFKQLLNDRFLDFGIEEKARTQFGLLEQRSNERVAEFFTRLEILASTAGYKLEASHVIQKVNEAVDTSIIDSIYNNSEILPKTYDQWKARCINLDESRRRRNEAKTELKKYGRYRGYQNPTLPPPRQYNPPPRQYNPPSGPPPPPASRSQAVPVADRRDASGTTYGGAGRPMELDKTRGPLTCYNCGKNGHMARDCWAPRRQQVRSVTVEEVQDEEANGRNSITDESYVRRHWANMDKEKQAALAKELGFSLNHQ
jgi:hypothetical protein